MLHLTYHNQRFSVSKIANHDICIQQLAKMKYRNNLKKRSKHDRATARLQHAWLACCVAEFCANQQEAYLLTRNPMQLNRLSQHQVASALAAHTGASVSTLSRWLKEFQVSVLFRNTLFACAELFVKSGQVERIRACFTAVHALQNQGMSLEQMTNDIVYQWLCLHQHYAHSRRSNNEAFQQLKFQLMLNNSIK